MRNTLVVALATGLACAVCTSPAYADDMTPKWGGLFVGLNVGATGLSSEETDIPILPPGPSSTVHGGPAWGGSGGLTWGYDWRLSPNVVVGTISTLNLESADVTVTEVNGTKNHLIEGYSLNTGLRLGVLTDARTLIYGKGGYSRAGFQFKYNPGGVGAYMKDTTFEGWFAGAGVQRKISDGLSLTLDYEFARYNAQMLAAEPPPPPDERHRMTPETQTVRVGFVYNLFNRSETHVPMK